MTSPNTLQARAPLYVDQLAISTTATPQIRIARSGGLGRQKLVFISTVDCYVRFGIMFGGVATNAYELYKANIPVQVEIGNDSTHFSVLGTGSGTFSYYIETSTGDVGDGFAGILGPLYVDEWARESGASATKWYSRKGRILTNTGAVTFAADGTNFNGTPVIGTDNSGRYMSGTGFSTMVTSGSFPYVCGVARFTFTGGGSQVIFGIAGATNTQLYAYGVGGTINGRYIGGVTTVSDGATDSSVHFYEIWIDGTNLNIAVDLATSSAAQPGAINQDLNAFSVGNDPIQNTLFMSGFHSRYIVANATPSLAQRTAMFQLCRRMDGF